MNAMTRERHLVPATGVDTSFLDWPVYGLGRDVKRARLTAALAELTEHHRTNCEPYARILQARSAGKRNAYPGPEDIPYLPVRLFKEFDLSSVPAEQVFKTLSSSGTSSQRVSRIRLDRDTAQAQSKALVRILQSFLGKERLPMLVIDHPGVLSDPRSFSARAAGILGFSSFGHSHRYALRDGSMALDLPVVEEFVEKHRGKRMLLFGFTFMVWQHFLKALQRSDRSFDLEGSLLIHGGGWKKLTAEAVSNAHFKTALQRQLNLSGVHSYYGMVEQTGSIHMECEHGRLHAPACADVIVRNSRDWGVQPIGEPGVIQVQSLLPRSYPGHSLLTEDAGTWLGEDDCPCGRLGKTFAVSGRLARAELRGCSDTQAEAASA